ERRSWFSYGSAMASTLSTAVGLVEARLPRDGPLANQLARVTTFWRPRLKLPVETDGGRDGAEPSNGVDHGREPRPRASARDRARAARGDRGGGRAGSARARGGSRDDPRRGRARARDR